MVAHVTDIDREIISDGALNVDIPVSHVWGLQVWIYAVKLAWRGRYRIRSPRVRESVSAGRVRYGRVKRLLTRNRQGGIEILPRSSDGTQGWTCECERLEVDIAACGKRRCAAGIEARDTGRHGAKAEQIAFAIEHVKAHLLVKNSDCRSKHGFAITKHIPR